MKSISYSEALRQAMIDEMERDRQIFLLGEDIGLYGGAFGVTRGMLDQFGPEWIINTPISEGSFVGMGIGAALVGSRPIVEIMFMDFVTLAVDQLVNQAAKLHYVFGRQAKCPLVVRTVGGAGKNYGPTHSQNLEAWFMHTPGLKVVAPATVADAYGMMRAAIRDDNPVIFLEHKLLYQKKEKLDLKKIKPSLAEAAKIREGDDITIIAYSYMSVEALAAAEQLAREGMAVDLIDLRSVDPLDEDCLVESARKTGKVIIVAENPRTGGVAAEIACRIFENAHDYLDAPICRLTMPDVPIPASPVLEKAAMPNRHDIVQAAREIVNNRAPQ